MAHPFADLIELKFEEQRPGYSRCTLAVPEKHLNPHGAVAFARVAKASGTYSLFTPGGHAA